MRVNVYSEEITDDVRLVGTAPDTGKTYHGIRFYLESSDKLHHSSADDDRSAVTFWGSQQLLRTIFVKALDSLPAAEPRKEEKC